MDDLISALFAAAMQFSGLHASIPPEVVAVPHEYFVKEACGGNPRCPVLGWFPNGGNKVFVDNSWDQKNELSNSIVVHEMTHYLQSENGMFEGINCIGRMRIELVAYEVQRQYLHMVNDDHWVGFNRASFQCEDKEPEVSAQR